MGDRFVKDSSEDTLRARINELGLALEMSGLKAEADGGSPAVLWKIIQDKFPKKAHRVGATSYDANQPGLRAEFEPGSVKVGMVTKSWSGAIIYFGKAFLAMQAPDQEKRLGQELDKIDKWWVESARVTKQDLDDSDITFRIRGLPSPKLIALRDKVKDLDAKAYVASLLTTSTPMEAGLTDSQSGLTLTVGKVTVVVAPDTTGTVPGGFDAVTTSSTSSTPSQIQVPPSNAQNIITHFDGFDPAITIQVQTTFRPGVSKDVKQGYGKGTTPREKELEATSLRYHEGSHGIDIVNFVKTHPYPVFTGRAGDTVNQFHQKAVTYINARAKFNADLQRFTDIREECPGKTIDQFMREKGVTSWTPICPHP